MKYVYHVYTLSGLERLFYKNPIILENEVSQSQFIAELSKFERLKIH